MSNNHKIPNDVRLFARANGVLALLRRAIELTGKKFKDVNKIELEIHDDPETAERSIVIDIIVKGTTDEILNQYDEYINDWIKLGSYDKREKINLTYTIH